MTIHRMNGFGNISDDSTELLAGDNPWLFATGTRALAEGRFGGNGYRFSSNQALSFDAGNYIVQRYWGGTWWANWANIGADSNIWVLRRDASIGGVMPSNIDGHAVVRLKADGALEVWTSSVLRQTTAAGLIIAGTDHHIEVRVYIDEPGTIDVWVDGVNVITVGADTQQSFTSPTGYFVSGGLSTDCVIDDFVVTSGNVGTLGSHQIHELLPDGAGDNADWTGAFTDVDDPLGAPDGDATVITALAGQDKQDHTFEALPVTPTITTVHAVELTVRARITEATPREIAQYTISGATETDEATKGLTEAYVTYVDQLLLDPNTAAPWTVAAVNALKLGVKIDGPDPGDNPYVFPGLYVPLAIVSGAVYDSLTLGRPEYDNTYVPQHIRFAQQPAYVTGGYFYLRDGFGGINHAMPDMTINQFNTDWVLTLLASIMQHSNDLVEYTLRFYDSLNAVKLYLEVDKVGSYQIRIKYGENSAANVSVVAGDAFSGVLTGTFTFTDTGVIWTSDSPTNDGAIDFTFAGTDMTDVVRVESTGGSLTHGLNAESAFSATQLNLIGGTLI